MDLLSFIFFLLGAMQSTVFAWIPEIVQDVAAPLQQIPGGNEFTELDGIPDSTANIGNLFRLTIPENAFSRSVDEYKVNEARNYNLPSWLYFNKSSSLLIGVPSSLDEGALIIEVTAFRKEGHQQCIATAFFTVNVQKVKEQQMLWKQDLNPSTTAIKYEAPSSNQKIPSKCEWDENVFHASLVLEATLNELNAKQKVKLLYKLANFISHSVGDITLGIRQSEAISRLLNKHVVIAGPGDANVTTAHRGVELTWFLGCGEKFVQLEDFVQIIEHNINTGRISNEVGFNVIGWQVFETQPAEPIRKLRRLKRQAMATPMPTQAVLASAPKVFIPVTQVVENTEPIEFSFEASEFVLPSAQHFLTSAGTPDTSFYPLSLEFSAIPLDDPVTFEDISSSSTIQASDIFSSPTEATPANPTVTSESVHITGVSTMESKTLHNTLEIPSSDTSLQIHPQLLVKSTSYTFGVISPTPAYGAVISTDSINSEIDQEWSIQSTQSPALSIVSSFDNLDNDVLGISGTEAAPGFTSIKVISQTLEIAPSTAIFAGTSKSDSAVTGIETSTMKLNTSLITLNEPTIMIQPSWSVDKTATVLLPTLHDTNIAPLSTTDTNRDSSMLPFDNMMIAPTQPINLNETSAVLPVISSILMYSSLLESSQSGYSGAWSVVSSVPMETGQMSIVPHVSMENYASMPTPLSIESIQVVSQRSEIGYESTQIVHSTFSDAVPNAHTSVTFAAVLEVESDNMLSSTELAPSASIISESSSVALGVPEMSSVELAQAPSKIEFSAPSRIPDTTPLLSTELIVDTLNVAESILPTSTFSMDNISSSVVLHHIYDFTSAPMSVPESAFDEQNETAAVPVIPTPTSKSDLIFSSFSSLNITLMGPPRPTPVQSHTQSETISASSTLNITVVGPPKTTALIIDMESIRSLYESAIYASAGYENDDLVTSDTSTKVDVTSKASPSMTYEISPTPISMLSEDITQSATEHVGPPTTVEVSTDPEANHLHSTGAPLNTQPFLLNPIDNISVSLGQYFEFKVPTDTFYDRQDGATEKLKLVLLNIDQSPLAEDSWVQFDEQRQVIFGLPLEKTVTFDAQEFSLAAVDSAGLVSERDAIVINVDTSAAANLNHYFYITFNLSYDSFMNETFNTIDAIFSIGDYFGGNVSHNILVSDIQNGSVVLKWSNGTLTKSTCDNDTVNAIFDKLSAGEEGVNPDFRAAMWPKFPVTSVSLEYAGSCLPLLPVATVPPIIGGPAVTKSGSNVLLYTVIPAVIIAIIIFVIAIILCYVRRKRRYSGKVMLDDERPIFNNDRKPVLLANELQLRDLSNVPKRPVVLDKDLQPSIDLEQDSVRPSPGVDGASRPKPPPYYYPDDFDPILDNLESPPPSYRGSPEGNTPPYGRRPPEYKLPPPYTAHVNPVFPNRGTSDA